MSKKIFASLLVVCMMFTLLLPACAIDSSNQIMSNKDSAYIIDKYAAEISFTSQVNNTTISNIDSNALEYIKNAIGFAELQPELYSQFRFGALMDDILVAILDLRNASSNTKNSASGTIFNERTTPVTNFQWIRGEHVDNIPKNTSISSSFSFTISAGLEIEGFPLTASATFGNGEQITFSGPSYNDTLSDGRTATHAVAFKALQGQIVKHEWDYINDIGGLQHIVTYKVEKSTARLERFTAFAHVQNNGFIYVESASGGNIVGYSSFSSLENYVTTNVGSFI